VPGLGKTVGIAGHRTTFGAPFRRIDDIEPGDPITLEMPYATFRYRVFKHEIVDESDWSVIRDRGFDALMLSACHPLYGSSERWIVYARLVEVTPRQGEAYTLAAGR
jgi:sortase A